MKIPYVHVEGDPSSKDYLNIRVNKTPYRGSFWVSQKKHGKQTYAGALDEGKRLARRDFYTHYSRQGLLPTVFVSQVGPESFSYHFIIDQKDYFGVGSSFDNAKDTAIKKLLEQLKVEGA